MERTEFWTQRRKERVGWFETVALKHVHYHMENIKPLEACCVTLGTQSQDSVTTEEGGIGEGDGRKGQEGGDMCIPMADSC